MVFKIKKTTKDFTLMGKMHLLVLLFVFKLLCSNLNVQTYISFGKSSQGHEEPRSELDHQVVNATSRSTLIFTHGPLTFSPKTSTTSSNL